VVDLILSCVRNKPAVFHFAFAAVPDYVVIGFSKTPVGVEWFIAIFKKRKVVGDFGDEVKLSGL
jgi:hypothetical protein